VQDTLVTTKYGHGAQVQGVISLGNHTASAANSNGQDPLQLITPISHGRPLVDRVVQQLRDLIYYQKLPPGSRLPSEPALAKELSVSRSTLREALRALRHLGLIDTRFGAGSYITEGLESGQIAVDPASVIELRELFEFREFLELEIAQLAAERRTDAQLTTIFQRLDSLHQTTLHSSTEQYASLDYEFHVAVAQASNNQHFVEAYTAYRARFLEGVKLLVSMQSLPHIAHLHDDLVAAIHSKSPRQASLTVQRTFSETRIRLDILEKTRSTGSDEMTSRQ